MLTSLQQKNISAIVALGFESYARSDGLHFFLQFKAPFAYSFYFVYFYLMSYTLMHTLVTIFVRKRFKKRRRRRKKGFASAVSVDFRQMVLRFFLWSYHKLSSHCTLQCDTVIFTKHTPSPTLIPFQFCCL